MKNLLKTIWNILRYIDGIFTIFRNAIFNTLLLLVLITGILTLVKSDKDDQTVQEIAPNSILELSLVGTIVEQKRFSEPLEKLLGDFENSRERKTSLQDLLDAINSAASNPKITAILINSEKMTAAGLNQLHSIGDALLNFRRTGKKVIAAADNYSQGEYFLASYADHIVLNPMGSVEIRGMGRYSLYFKEAIDTLKIDYNIFKVGSHKSAVEPFSRDSMSKEDRQQSLIWLTTLWADFSSQVTANRKLEKNALDIYTSTIEQNLQQAGGDTAKMALEQGLIDALYTRQELKSYLHTITGQPEDRELNSITVKEYFERTATPHSYAERHGEIGIIVAEGIILDGEQEIGKIGGDTLANLIEEARLNPDIKALVLRINSGGGSAFASEVIRQELLLFKEMGKKLVVSMGSIAASGGYWIAANADQIWASPSTLTGSIGVFGAMPTFHRSLAAIGVHRDGVGTTPLASGASPLAPLNPLTRSLLQQTIEHTYRFFLDIVATGRSIPPEQVARIAQGKVYDGILAKEIGLVDELGDLSQAIAAAKELTGIKEATAFYIRPKRTIRQQIVDMFGSIRFSLLSFLAGDQLRILVETAAVQPDLTLLQEMPDSNHIYSYTPPLLFGSSRQNFFFSF